MVIAARDQPPFVIVGLRKMLTCDHDLQRVSPSFGFCFLSLLDSSRVLGSLGGFQSPVEDNDPLSCNEDGDNCQSNRDEDETTSKLVEWFLVPQEEVWSKPMRSGSKSVGNSDQGGFLVSGTWDQLSFPGDLNVETGENTHDQETHSSVSHSDIEGGDQHDGADS